MQRKRRKPAPGSPPLFSGSAPHQNRHPASAPPMPPPEIMRSPFIGFMKEFGETLKRHSQLLHRQVLAWRMIRLTEDLNKILSHALRESPSWITASYANAAPLTMHRELYHPKLPRVLQPTILLMSELPPSRKRKLAQKVTDDNNVAEPALKQHKRHHSTHVQDPLDDDSDVAMSDSEPGLPDSRSSNKAGDDKSDSGDDPEVILEEFVPKKKGERRSQTSVTARAKSDDSSSIREETAEEELARLMKGWDAPVYGFYEPIPDIVYADGNRRCHVFKGSTSNLRAHSKKCWGLEAFEKADEMKDLAKVREVVNKAKNSPNRNIVTMFARLEAKGVVSYMHRQHTSEEVRAVIVKWVAESMRPYSIVEDEGFHMLMKTGRPMYRIPSMATVARDVKHVFKKTKMRIAKILQEYPGSLSFATDCWTSPNHKAYVTITVHLEKDGLPLSFLLDIMELATSHSGINLARAFADMLKEFEIGHKILAITSDNASSNDKMTDRLMRHLSMFRGPKTRVRCFLHIVNLVAKVIVRQFDAGKVTDEAGNVLAELEDNLDGDDEERVDELASELLELGDDEEIESVEPMQTVIRKLRKISFAVKNSSTLALPEWFKILDRLNISQRMIPRDVKTRWNSTYDMLKFAVEYRTAIDELTANRKFELREYEMNQEEWVLAAQLCKVLKVFKDATLSFSKSASNIARILPAMVKIDEVLATNATDSTYLPAIQAALAVGAKLLNRYYELTDMSDVYRIATILHPSYKIEYLQKAGWQREWIDKAVQIIKEEFLRTYSEMETQETGSASTSTVRASGSVNVFEDLSDFGNSTPTASITDELTHYLGSERERVKDILVWWKQKQDVFPRLARMALDYHCHDLVLDHFHKDKFTNR
ncbi:hypothetical protein M378DRAFT_18675 [Amanita muscaria Koide BX008]|uniref:HAT C-terminal dimerisation domain-containing protein n=1 Tax=Amanita muscaria (strain Koide BX008) TaxID=946122 RepID=A0A0C2WDK5_AMAMK|nr:hypothetical protein M378DRAFT_18675 [Amanita muscaria Koide BX008]